MNQLVLYDGTGYSFQKAIPRSIQRSGAWKVADLTVSVAFQGFGMRLPLDFT
jgi:hypothetical protein